jgi:hypothetical protein
VLVAGEVSSIAASQIALIICNKAQTASNFRLGLDTAGKLTWAAAQSSSQTATSVNGVTVNTPFIAIGREVSDVDRTAILNGDIANEGNNTTSRIPTGIDRLSFGKKDDVSNNNPWQGVIHYAAVWSVALSDAECAALGRGAPPSLIRPAALRSYWPAFGRSDGTTVIDVLGRAPLTLAGGSNSASAARRVMPSGALTSRRAPVVTGSGRAWQRPGRKFQHLVVR